jgi:hypothetical protein
MIMKLKNRRPGPMVAVEPVKKKIVIHTFVNVDKISFVSACVEILVGQELQSERNHLICAH